MERLKEANLSPHLVYGVSSGGTSGTADKVATTDVQQPQFRTPAVGSLDVLGQYYDYEIKQAQADNLRAQNTVILEDAALKAASRKKLGIDTQLAQDTLGFSVDAAREQLRKIKADTNFVLSENERKAAMNSANLYEAADRILTNRVGREEARARIRSTNLGNQLKQLDVDLREKGIFPSDPIWARILGRILTAWEKNPPSLFPRRRR